MNKTKLAKNIALLIISTAIALFLVDALSRPFLTKLLYYRPEDFLSKKSFTIKTLEQYQPNRSCTWEAFGDLAAMTGDRSLCERRLVRFETDGNGFRNGKNEDPDRPYDVVVAGDSFALGCGSSQEKTWSNLLESRYGLKTYNFAMHGGGPWQEYINLNFFIDKIKTGPETTLLWVLFPPNDLDDDYGPTLEIAELPKGSAWNTFRKTVSGYFKKSPIRQLIRRYRHKTQKSNDTQFVIIKDWPGEKDQKILFFLHYADRRQQSYEQAKTHPNYQRLDEVITAMKAFAEKHDLRLKVVLAPSKEEIYDWALEGREPWSIDRGPSPRTKVFENLCRNHDIEYMDLYPYLKEAAKDVYMETKKPIYWYDDTHWNETGQELAAKKIYEFVKQ